MVIFYLLIEVNATFHTKVYRTYNIFLMSTIMAKVVHRKLFASMRATLLIVIDNLVNVDFFFSKHSSFLDESPDRVYQKYDF